MGKSVGHAMSKLLIGKTIILTSKRFLNWSNYHFNTIIHIIIHRIYYNTKCIIYSV